MFVKDGRRCGEFLFTSKYESYTYILLKATACLLINILKKYSHSSVLGNKASKGSRNLQTRAQTKTPSGPSIITVQNLNHPRGYQPHPTN